MIRATSTADEVGLAVAHQDEMAFGIPLDFDFDGYSPAGFRESSADQYGNKAKGISRGELS